MTENKALTPRSPGIEDQVEINPEPVSLADRIEAMTVELGNLEPHQKIVVVQWMVHGLGKQGVISNQDAKDINWFLSDALRRQARNKRWEEG